MERLTNFSVPLDVAFLDTVVQHLYTNPDAKVRTEAQRGLMLFKNHPEAWTRVADILEKSTVPSTKVFALGVLDDCIQSRWAILPAQQRQGIRNYIVAIIIKLSSSADSLVEHKLYLSKLNYTLVQILKQEWPGSWSTFIPEIVGASRTNQALCENNMRILKLLSEEIFDFGRSDMTSAKVRELKERFNAEFASVFQLCEFVLDHSQHAPLLLATIETLLRFLNWVPLGYVFDTRLIDTLTGKFLPVGVFRNATLACLTEIASISDAGDANDAHFERMFVTFMGQLKANMLPLETDVAAAYAAGTHEEQKFVNHLCLFLTAFFRCHLPLLENKTSLHALLLEAHAYLANITLVQEREIFKVCLEYWGFLASQLYHEAPVSSGDASPLLLGAPSAMASPSTRQKAYAPILTRVRFAIISQMAKPEEVLIVEDDQGDIVREVTKDTDAIILYQSMQETLVYLTHLDAADTQRIMLDKLERLCNGTEWSWQKLNTLCWAIGSISGTQSVKAEKRFLVMVIRDLLGLCEMKRGKANKAVIASNIMYTVGQYPRFLRAHWRFLRTVVNKLFEFMHELHPGVQDMACDTFLKIARKCRRKFVVIQMGEEKPFVETIIEHITTVISDLSPSQIQTFYEAVGVLITAETEPSVRDRLLASLMKLPNGSWGELMAAAKGSVESLKTVESAKSVGNILRTNVKVATALGHAFMPQLVRMYMDLLNVYRVYSEVVSASIAQHGAVAAATPLVRYMRAAKRETLKLLGIFFEATTDPEFVVEHFLPPLLSAVLDDYQRGHPSAREPEVLTLATRIMTHFSQHAMNVVPTMFAALFECTLQMLVHNFEDHPDHRRAFFTFLQALVDHCFPAVLTIAEKSPPHFKLIMDSIVWAFKHRERTIAEQGLVTLLQLWRSICQSRSGELSNAFFRQFFLPLIRDLFVALTDGLHKSSFKLQAIMLRTMCHSIEKGTINTPLYPQPPTDPSMNNQLFLRQCLSSLLASWKTLSPEQIRSFVQGLMDTSKGMSWFKNHLRDLLVQLKSFSAQDDDNADLYLEEQEAQAQALRQQEAARKMAVPGLVAPHDRPEYNDMEG